MTEEYFDLESVVFDKLVMGHLRGTGSVSDMTRRKVLQKHKNNMLKNLNMFVSPNNRLCMQNQPLAFWKICI